MTDITNPRCITNYAMIDDLLYANLPCHNNRGTKSLNRFIEKSDASAAYLPSFPIIPTPTSAAYIIATSLPPSPIDNVIYFVNNFIASVIRAFYVGEHLQQITEGTLLVTYKNYVKHYDSAIDRLAPSITKTDPFLNEY